MPIFPFSWANDHKLAAFVSTFNEMCSSIQHEQFNGPFGDCGFGFKRI